MDAEELKRMNAIDSFVGQYVGEDATIILRKKLKDKTKYYSRKY